MKKLLGISLIALLAANPMMAMAEAPEGGVAAAEATIAAEAPYYETVTATATTDIASTSYVKGAYNDAIKAVNKTYQALDSRLDSAEDFISNADSNYAKVDLSNLDESGTAVITNAVKDGAAGADYDNTTSLLSATTIQGAIDELDSDVGNLSTLTTTEKGSVVGAINELNSALGTATADMKAGVVSTINHSGTVVHTTWGADTVAFAADTVRAADEYNYNKYYATYSGSAEAISSTAGAPSTPAAPAQGD